MGSYERQVCRLECYLSAFESAHTASLAARLRVWQTERSSDSEPRLSVLLSLRTIVCLPKLRLERLVAASLRDLYDIKCRLNRRLEHLSPQCKAGEGEGEWGGGEEGDREGKEEGEQGGMGKRKVGDVDGVGKV